MKQSKNNLSEINRSCNNVARAKIERSIDRSAS